MTGVHTSAFLFSSRRRHTRSLCDWSSDVCSSDLSCMARARPGALTYATPGVGTVLHLAMERLQERARIRLVHVPYRGVAQVTSEVMEIGRASCRERV